MNFIGFVYNETGRYAQPEYLEDKKALIEFIAAHWEAKQLIITDRFDKQLLLMREGVDLFNQLGQFGIQLSGIFQHIRANLVTEQDASKKPVWESP